MNKEIKTYEDLANYVGDMVLCNNLLEDFENLDLKNGDYENDIFQAFIITNNGARFLMENTDEVIFYHQKLDIYIWGITHFGTPWKGVNLPKPITK